MKELLNKLEAVYNLVVAKEAEVSQRLSAVTSREANVTTREQKATAYESAEAVLAEVTSIRQKIVQEQKHLGEGCVAFENECKKERQAIADEYGRLQPLKDKEQQLFVDQQALYAREAALEVEKNTYAARIKQELRDHFKNTGGRVD